MATEYEYAKRVVDLAEGQIGYTEGPPDSNRTKFGEWFGLNGVAWCGIFVSWCFHHARVPLGNIGFKNGFAGCQTAVAHFRKTGQVTTTPRAGDIVFYDWNGDGRYDHTGIYVAKLSATQFEAIEGNTSLANNSNGGSVMRRKRDIRNALFVRPKYPQA